MQTQTEKLAEFIRQHDCSATVLANGRISATCRATQNGVAFDDTTELAPTLYAVRDWLGY